MAILLPWGILMRRNSAAHRRVLILATICISDAGFLWFVVSRCLSLANYLSRHLPVLRGR